MDRVNLIRKGTVMNNHDNHQDKDAAETLKAAAGENIEQSVGEIIQEVTEKKEHKHDAHAEKNHKDHGKTHEPDAKKNAEANEEEIKKLKDEVESLKDSRLRVLAEFDNYKRRTARDSVRLIESANESLLKSIIPVVENFERALHPDHKTGDADALLKGVELVYNHFIDILKKTGLTETNPTGEEFNPENHEAIMHIESADVPENKIIQVFQKGYTLNNKVIQYAKVSVSKGNTPEKQS